VTPPEISEKRADLSETTAVEPTGNSERTEAALHEVHTQTDDSESNSRRNVCDPIGRFSADSRGLND
jgi:hypothetical protein